MLIAVDEEWLINSDIANRRARMNDAQLISKLGTENEILKEKLEIAVKALEEVIKENEGCMACTSSLPAEKALAKIRGLRDE